MGLIVCDICKCVDNTNCLSPDWNNLNQDFPNMSSMEMYGFRDKWKTEKIRENEIILCSECNTGTWHDEWEKQIATDIEIEMARQMQGNIFTSHALCGYYTALDKVTLEDVIQYGIDSTKKQTIREITEIYNKIKWTNQQSTPYIRETQKIGRNTLCLCNSGKKYKNCCLNKKENK